jgi:endoglucanase
MITAALFRAAVRWDDPRYHDAAMALARDIRRLLVVETQRGAMLLPGVSGFNEHGTVTINPSYYLFPAMHQIALETGDPIWQTLSSNGVALLRTARFGHWNLTPDWISLPAMGDVRPSERWPARFSFDAVRVPLYLCWGGFAHEPAVEASLAFWNAQNPAAVPAWTDVRTGEMAPYAQSAGMTAIRRYVAAIRSGKDKTLVIPTVAEAADYYAGALILQVQIAVDAAMPVA